MATETKQAAEKIDINDPNLQVESLEVNVEADQFQYPPPPAEGTYRAKLKQKETDGSLWTRNFTKKGNKPYLQTAIECRLIAPDSKYDDWPVFDNFVSTLVQETSGTNRIVGILRALGVQVPARTTDKELAQLLTEVLAKEPDAMITVQWEGYCPTCEKTAVKGEKRFPQLENGGHRGNMECPKDGSDVQAQARIVRYQQVTA